MASHTTESEREFFHNKLTSMGIEIEEYENDSFQKLVFENEKILAGNRIELLI